MLGDESNDNMKIKLKGTVLGGDKNQFSIVAEIARKYGTSEQVLMMSD